VSKIEQSYDSLHGTLALEPIFIPLVRPLMPCTKESLLIVDDAPSIRMLLSQLLARDGYTTRSAENGFSALAEIRREVPDLLLSDLNMPGMSGFELLTVVRRQFPSSVSLP
jgi:CheY-like chemotaxis protein